MKFSAVQRITDQVQIFEVGGYVVSYDELLPAARLVYQDGTPTSRYDRERIYTVSDANTGMGLMSTSDYSKALRFLREQGLNVYEFAAVTDRDTDQHFIYSPIECYEADLEKGYVPYMPNMEYLGDEELSSEYEYRKAVRVEGIVILHPPGII